MSRYRVRFVFHAGQGDIEIKDRQIEINTFRGLSDRKKEEKENKIHIADWQLRH